MPIDDTHPRRHRHPGTLITRRTAITAGAIGLMGLGMNHVAALRALADGTDADADANTRTNPRGRHPRKSKRPPKAKAVIYIFLSGGLAQQDSFDLKPDAPDNIRGEFEPIKTKTPGIQICEHLPQLAKRSDKWALLRSLTHPYNEHSDGHMVMLTGRTPMPRGFDRNKPKPTDWPSIAAVANDLLPYRTNLPPALVLPQKLVHRTGRVIPGQFAGIMGEHRNPWFVEASPYHPKDYGAFPEFLFHHAEGKQQDKQLVYQAPNLSLPHGLKADRFQRRLALRRELDSQRRLLEGLAEVDKFDRQRQAAVSLLADAKVQKAFDVQHADAKLQDAYGRNSFGWSLLMAANLVEAGVSLVQVNLGNNETWDTHQAAFPNLKNFLFPPTDKAVSALLDDLESRGLLDQTLIVMAGEFGRTPRVFKIPKAKLPGRDHWGACQTVFFAGGGVPGGRVIGASDKHGGYPASDPWKPENLAATIYDALGLPPTIAWHDDLTRPHHVYHGQPIRGLM